MEAAQQGSGTVLSGVEFRFGPALPADIPALAAVFAGSVAGSCGSDYTPAQIRAWIARATPERWRELFDSGLYFIKAAAVDGSMAGFTSVGASGYLHSMFVLPAFQRRGVASALLAQAVACARGHGAERMHTEASLTARPFFVREGFSTDKRQEVELDGELLANFRMSRLL